MLPNLLVLEPELMERLRTHLGNPAIHVLCAADLAGVTEEKQLTPAVHVVCQGYRVTESRGDGRAARVEQTWLVVVATRNVRGLGNLKDADAARAAAGSLAALVANALMGWRPPGAAKPLRLVDGPRADYSAGHQYLPLAFAAELLLNQESP